VDGRFFENHGQLTAVLPSTDFLLSAPPPLPGEGSAERRNFGHLVGLRLKRRIGDILRIMSILRDGAKPAYLTLAGLSCACGEGLMRSRTSAEHGIEETG